MLVEELPTTVALIVRVIRNDFVGNLMGKLLLLRLDAILPAENHVIDQAAGLDDLLVAFRIVDREFRIAESSP